MGGTKKDQADTGAESSTTDLAAAGADQSRVEEQQKLVQEATNTGTDANTIREGERAAKLKYDIQGGLGNHSAGTVIRNLSESAFITLTQGGGHDIVEPGTDVGADAVDAAAPL